MGSLCSSITLSNKLTVMKNKISRHLLRNYLNDYNISDIPSRITTIKL